MPPNGSLASVMAWMTDHLSEPLTLDSVAAEAHMSSQTLARRFRAATGTSARDYRQTFSAKAGIALSPG